VDRPEDLDAGLAAAGPFDEAGDEEGEEAGRLGEGDVTHGFDEPALYWHVHVLFRMQTGGYGARMQTMARESWTDERLDDLNGRVGDGFRRVDERFDRVDERFKHVDERFRQVDERFRHVDERFDRLETRTDERFDRVESRLDHLGTRVDGMQRTMLQGVIALCGVFAAGFGVLGGLIITQL
jgi:hypothetical protein